MHAHRNHDPHTHVHGPGCGHVGIRHDGHTDYLHDAHLHHSQDGHVEEHAVDVDGRNPSRCTPDHACAAHDAAHVHGEGCGHEAIPHGDHVDYLVAGHLHHPCTGHCDDHGQVRMA